MIKEGETNGRKKEEEEKLAPWVATCDTDHDGPTIIKLLISFCEMDER
jgi:hypothetical protein